MEFKKGQKAAQVVTKVASAYFLSWYCLVPSGTSFRGLKVRVLPLASPYQLPVKKVYTTYSQAKKCRHLLRTRECCGFGLLLGDCRDNILSSVLTTILMYA
jgi:hypothetical protein